MSDSYDDYETKIQLAEHEWEKRVDEIMDREEIIRMAREAGFQVYETDVWITDGWWLEELERFTALVVAHEREACAKVCDAEASIEGIAQRCADAIRIRGMRHE